MPKIGKIIAEDEESYRYLAESICRFPLAADFEKMIQEVGFVNTRSRSFLAVLSTFTWLESLKLDASNDPHFSFTKMGRILARHGALRGIESDPNTPEY